MCEYNLIVNFYLNIQTSCCNISQKKSPFSFEVAVRSFVSCCFCYKWEHKSFKKALLGIHSVHRLRVVSWPIMFLLMRLTIQNNIMSDKHDNIASLPFWGRATSAVPDLSTGFVWGHFCHPDSPTGWQSHYFLWVNPKRAPAVLSLSRSPKRTTGELQVQGHEKEQFRTTSNHLGLPKRVFWLI